MFEGLYMSNKFVVVDLETTGNSVKKGDRIIQFAAVVIENGRIIDQYSTLLCPNKPIPIFIEELTGLTDEMVKDAPLFSEIAPKVMELLDGAFFVAHNVLFDLSFLQEELIMAGYEGFYGPVLDTVEMARILFPTSDSYKLTELAVQEGLNHERPHQADSDAYVTGELLILLLNKLSRLPLRTIKQLCQLSGGLKSDLIDILEELVNQKERKVEAVLEDLEEYNGIYIKRLDETYSPSMAKKNTYPFSSDEKEKIIEKAYQSYERRIGQFQMMDLIYEAFQKEQHAIIEAGTGVGKSLGYLLPSVYYSISTNEPVIISTYTTQLQDQLVQHEIPLLKKMIPFSFESVLVKGKSHYINLEKFIYFLRDLDDNYDTTLTKMQILVWLTETITGDKEELNLSSGGQLFWNKIKNDGKTYQQNKDKSNRDFYLTIKRKAEEANLIIINHHLLLSDMLADSPILPKSNYIVIDEGHHFEKVAGKSLGDKIDYAYTRYLLQQMGIYDQKLLAYRLEKMFNGSNILKKSAISSYDMNKLMAELLYEMDEFFKAAALYAKRQIKNKNQTQVSSPIRFNTTKDVKAIMVEAERFLFLLQDYTKAVSDRYELFIGTCNNPTMNQQAVLSEISSWLKDIEKVKKSIRKFLTQEEEEVAWIEMDLRSWQNSTTLFSQPISVSNRLNDLFFQQKKSVIITSATLSVKGSFHYLVKQLGLKNSASIQKKIPSPFQYEEKLKLIIANDLPEINNVSLEDYVSVISEHIISIAEATKGRLLVLFTSHDMLRKTHEIIKESGFLQNFTLLAQGISSGSRERLLRNFKQFEKAILFGTASFWEGIDVPGDALSCIIMVRLPFTPPDEPLTEAKCKEIKANGGNPFYEYSLPEAVIRFKQGFGRLIRTKNDKGLIIIFDRRIVSTLYGKTFLESLPAVSAQELDIMETVELIDKWL